MAHASVWVAATIALLATTASCTDQSDTESASTPRQPARCFQARDARNFRAVNSSTVHVRANRDVYRIEVLGVCPDLTFNPRMSLVTTGTSTVCAGAGLGTSLRVRTPSGQQTCRIRQITV